MFRTRIPSRSLSAAALAVALIGAAAAPAAAQTGLLGLVLDETRVRQGALEAAVVVRTTAARPLAAGSFAVDLRDKDGLPGGPYTALLGVEVLSGAGDAVADASFDPLTYRTQVSFSSASGSVNESFGPMVILRYALDPALELDRRFVLRLDPDSLALAATDGQPVWFHTEKGRLRIDDADADVGLEAEASDTRPGAQVVFGAKTEILGRLVSGTVEFLYESGWENGDPVVGIHPAYGAGVIDAVALVAPGHLLVTFHATGDDLNERLPGPFLTVAIPSLPSVPVGAVYEVTLGPGTAVVDGNGQLVEVEPRTELIKFRRNRFQFGSGFDDGSLDDFWDDNP